MRIAIYPRKSVYRDNSDSVEVQVKMGKEYAQLVYRDQELEFFVYDKDEGFSGKNTDRPSFQELMRDVKSNKLDVVIVYKLDRISRNVREFSEMYDTMQEHNVAFVSVKESFDTSTPIGRTVMYILAAFSQLERENTSERVGDNMRQLGESGKWTGGKLPAGMSSVRKRVDGKEHSYLVVDEEKIGKVKMLYELFLEGYTITALERYCRDHDITSQGGKFMATNQIYGIVTNPVYCQNDLQAYYYFKEKGCRVADKHLFDGESGLMGYGRTSGGGKSFNDMTKWTIAVGIHDYVMPSDKWIAVQNRLKQNKQVRTLKHESGILRGVLRCRCGSSMQLRTYIKNSRTFSYYYCDTRNRKGIKYCDSEFVKVDVIDDMFINKLREIRIDDNFISAGESTHSFNDIKAIKKSIKETESALGNLTVQLQNNVSSSAAKYIVAQIEKLDKKLNILNSQLQYEEIKKDKTLTEQEERAVIYKNICLLLDNFDSLTYKEKNEIIRSLVRKCVIDGKDLKIIF